MKKINRKWSSFTLITLLILTTIFANIGIGWADELAEVEKTWDVFQNNLTPLLPRIKLSEPINTEEILNQHKAGLKKLTEEPFLEVVGFNYTAGIEQRIVLAQKNIDKLEEISKAILTSIDRIKESNLSEKLQGIIDLDPEIQKTAQSNLQLFDDIAQIYQNLKQPGGSLELINQGIAKLKQKITDQQKARELASKEYLELLSSLTEITKADKINNAVSELSNLINNAGITDFLNIIDNWFKDPTKPFSDQLLKALEEIYHNH